MVKRHAILALAASATLATGCGGSAHSERDAAAGFDAPGMPDAPAMPDASALPDAAPTDAWVAGGWCDTTYPLRRRLTARNNAATPLPVGFQVYWLIDLEDLATPAPSDTSLHVFHETPAGCGEIVRMVDDSAASYEAIWIALVDAIPASATDASYWLYYGNDAAPAAPPDPSLIFDFYEAFSTGTGPDEDWLTMGTPAFAPGMVLLGLDDHIMTMTAWGAGYAVDYSLIIPFWLPPFWSGFQRDADDFLDEPPWILWYAAVNPTGAVLWPSIRLSDADMAWSGSQVAIDADQHIYNIDRFADRVVFRYENYPASAEEHALAAPFTDPLRFRASNLGTSTLRMQMVRVRQTAHPLPSSTVGTTETP